MLWPETVINARVTPRPGAAPALRRGWRATWRDALRRRLTDAGVGRIERALRLDPRANPSDVAAVYDKEQLVPFAEYVPGPAWLRKLPFGDEIGDSPGPQRGRDATARHR